MNMYYFIINRL